MKTSRPGRLIVRAALRIHDRLMRMRDASPLPSLPQDTWNELASTSQRLTIATRRGWPAAATVVRREVQSLTSILGRHLDDFRREVAETAAPERLPSPRDILDELTALNDEFGDLRIDLSKKQLAATTESLILGGIDLGPFEIVLNWDLIGQSRVYEVLAQQPNPASGNSGTTHPHVHQDRLCEGDGQAPIRQALIQGRLLDFFVLVRQILRTYNPDSAFVSLENWFGTECRDCGRSMSDDESTSCERCSTEICLDCSYCCQDCGRTCCGDCRSSCRGCDNDFCDRCLSSCRSCDEDFCSNCLSGGQCPDCRLAEEESDEPQDETPAISSVPA